MHQIPSMNFLQVCEETLAAHMERLAQLRGLVAQIAADVGLDPGGLLQGEVEALGQRLDDVRASLTTLADVAETRAIDKETRTEELDGTRTFLNNVQKVKPRYFYFTFLCQGGKLSSPRLLLCNNRESGKRRFDSEPETVIFRSTRPQNIRLIFLSIPSCHVEATFLV